jgi:hypothetical protein
MNFGMELSLRRWRLYAPLDRLEMVPQDYLSGKRLHGVRQSERDESIMAQFILCAGRPEQKTT